GSTGAALSGGAAVNTVSGVAAFGTVGIDLAGVGYKLQTTNGASLANATSSAFNVGAGTGTNMTPVAGTTNQTATVGTAVPNPPAVRVTDASGNPVSGVAVTFTVATGTGTVNRAGRAGA